MRQPLEERRVTIAELTMTLTFPASLILVAASNLVRADCERLPARMLLYAAADPTLHVENLRPLMDRIDIQIDVPAFPYKDFQTHALPNLRKRAPRSSRASVQFRRFYDEKIYTTRRWDRATVRKFCVLTADAKDHGEPVTNWASPLVVRQNLKSLTHNRDLAGDDDLAPKHLVEPCSTGPGSESLGVSL